MVVNFRARGISRGARKLARTPTIIKKKNPFYMMAYSIKVTWKGVVIEFEKIQSTLRILDLSNNSFTGEIPKEIGKLKAVRQLNLSHNSLTGHIQSSLGMFTNLESLDLSSNLLNYRKDSSTVGRSNISCSLRPFT